MSAVNKVFHGLGWGGLSTVTVAGFQIILMGVMARLLDPADFGLVAMANVSLRFFSYFAQMGVGPAIIQKETLSESDVQAALAVSLGVSCFFFILAVVLSPFAQMFFGIPKLAFVICAISLNFVISGFSTVSSSLMRRRMAFKKIAIFEIISYVMGFGAVGIILAYSGFGVWALVCATLAQNIIGTALIYFNIRHPLNFKYEKHQRDHFWNYGRRYSVIGFLEFLTISLDSVVIGKTMGDTAAGHYSRAALLANLPVQTPTALLTKTIFPVLSANSKQKDMVSACFQLCLLLVGGYALSVGASISLASADIVKVLLGEKWGDTIPVLQILAWSVGPLYISQVVGTTLDALGELKAKLRIQASMLALLAVLIFLVANGKGMTAIAMAVVVTEWIRVAIYLTFMVKLLDIKKYEVSVVLGSILMFMVTSMAMVFLVMNIMPKDWLPVVRLIAEISSAGVGLGGAYFVTRSHLTNLQSVQQLGNKVPIVKKLFQ